MKLFPSIYKDPPPHPLHNLQREFPIRSRMVPTFYGVLALEGAIRSVGTALERGILPGTAAITEELAPQGKQLPCTVSEAAAGSSVQGVNVVINLFRPKCGTVVFEVCVSALD